MKPVLIIFTILLAFLLLKCSFNQEPEITAIPVIENGKAINVKIAGKSWIEKDSFLERTGLYNELYANKKPVSNDFEVTAKLSLSKIDSTTALFTFFNHHFGFDSDSGKDGPVGKNRLFIYSPEKDTLLKFGKAADYITPGVPFQFQMISSEEEVIFKINQKEVARVSRDIFGNPFLGGVGFRPWRNTMRIYDFHLKGAWTDFPEVSYVYQNEEDGYHCFRNPAIVKTGKNTLLAFAQGRKEDCYDLGDRDILVKRSMDDGNTWSAAITVFNDGENTCTGPVPIVDEASGRIYIIMTRIAMDYTAENEFGVREAGRRVYLSYSEDDGLSWTKPIDISEEAINPNWDIIATGPGSGIQLKNGVFKDRLIVPCYHRKKDDKALYAHSMYSDDHGLTWKTGESLQGGVTECQIAELKDGRLIMTMRQQDESIKARQIAYSSDGGVTWADQTTEIALMDDGCQGSIAFYNYNDKSMVLLANPVHDIFRLNMSITASFDDGSTWEQPQSLHQGPSGYSDLIVLDSLNIACFFEHGMMWTNEGLLFKKIPIGAVLD